ncbi:hypothetical protein RJT34_31993 [Clitoria ternatea]|uniref:Large ribosomal subunit protein uL1c n=1 Tax=Clitoria ternatea TaxID=43366 RepID=A0AAN9I437_CLITE
MSLRRSRGCASSPAYMALILCLIHLMNNSATMPSMMCQEWLTNPLPWSCYFIIIFVSFDEASTSSLIGVLLCDSQSRHHCHGPPATVVTSFFLLLSFGSSLVIVQTSPKPLSGLSHTQSTMAAVKLLVSQSRRHCLSKHTFPLFLTSHRSLSSDSNSNPPRRTFEPIPIQPVSYPVKPKEPDTQPLSQPPPPRPRLASDTADPPRAWTREEIRYVKDAGSSIAPVSYPTRVAPLPEDRDPAEAGKNEEMERERRKIEEEGQLRMRMVKAVEEEKMKVPFPLLIKPKKNEKPPVVDLAEAIRQVKAKAKAKFDETVEVHVRLGIDSKRTEMAVRGTVVLPHGAPKAVSVAVFAEGAEAEEAKAAGADIVGGKELIEEIASGKNKLKVDKCFSTPGMAPHLGKIAQYLRKRRLMPDKKLGTLTSDIAGQLKELRQGRVEFKMESKSILHVGVGKVSYKEEALRENIGAFMNAVLLSKPTGLKKTSKYAGYVLSVHMSSTMGPGLPVSIQSLSKAADNYKKMHVV